MTTGSECGACLGADVVAPAQHCDRGGDHDHGEPDQEHSPRDEAGEQSAPEGTGHAGHAEHHTGPPLDAAGPCVRDRADRTGDAYHQQRGGDGLFRIHASHVGQQRDGQDRTAATEQAQGDTDQDGEGDG